MSVSDITGILSVLFMLVGIILVIRQLALSRRISAADFAVRLDDDLYKYREIFREFFPDGKWAPGNEIKLNNEEMVNIQEYLAFFETLNTLLKRELVSSFLSIEDFDELFGYRFFMTMHNPIVKNIIALNPDSWRSLQALYWGWLEYRKGKGKDIIQEEYQWIR